MNSKSVISGLMAVCMIASAPAFAQRGDYGNGRDAQDQQSQRGDNQRGQDRGWNDRNDRGDRNDRNDRGDRNDRHDRGNQNDYRYRNDRNGYSGGQNSNNGYSSYRPGPRYEMRRGGYLPQEYRGRQYVVNDWHGRHLSAPPRGHQWVQANNDYVLVALATGLIAQVLLNN
jgi:Ni/Co efflux regulator RcnB